MCDTRLILILYFYNNLSSVREMEEDGQTIEFYKIKLMEKEREISNFEAKLKKIEFKHSRDLKEAKMAEERANNLLKEEKNKSDKFSKQAKENQEQNNLLQLRLTELKEDKEKEITDVRSQYNKIKEEIRSYERILPTHTFLSDCGVGIDELPIYEDIFHNLKDKVAQLQQLNQKYESYRAKKEEQISTLHQNEELLKQKKLEIQNNFQEMLPKTIEYEQQISDLKINVEHLQFQITDLKNQLEVQKNHSQQLEEEIKQNDNKLEQISQAFTSEVHNKEEEIKAYYGEEIERYEQQLKALTSRSEIKQSMYVSQLSIMEEDNNLLKSRLQQAHDRHEETHHEAEQEVEKIKTEVEQLRKTIEDLTKDNDTKQNALEESKRSNEELQEKIKLSEIRLKDLVYQHQQKQKQEEIHISQKILQIQLKCNQLQKTNENLKDQVINLQQQKETLSQQMTQVRIEVQVKKQESAESHKLQIPSQFQQYYEKYRRYSNQFNKSNLSEDELQFVPVEKEELVRERTRTIEIIKQNEEYMKQINNLKIEKQELKDSNSASKQEIKTLDKKIKEQSNELKSKETEKKKMQEQVESLKKEREKLVSENISLKQKMVVLNKSLYENEEKVSGNSTKVNLQHAKIDSLQKQNSLLTQQLNKQKEALKPLKEDLKNTKEELSFLSQKYAKETKQTNLSNQTLSNERQKFKNDLIMKEKALANAQSSISHYKEVEERLKNQHNELQKDFNTLLQKKLDLEKEIQELGREIEKKVKQITRLEQQNLEKDRENEMINSSLDRERRERTIRTVPSLQFLGGEKTIAEEQNFQDIYLMVTQKEGEINILQRQVSDLKEEIQSLKANTTAKSESLETELNEYIQTIIEMKMRCAESQMRASEKQFLYNQLKKRLPAE